MKYHTGRRFGLAESVQSMIYWTCMNYEHLDDPTRALIGQAARVSGERDANVVLEALTTPTPIPEISLRYCCTSTPVDASQLARKVRAAYLFLARTLPCLKKSATGTPPPP